MKAIITFHNMPHSNAIEAHAKEKSLKIEHLLSSSKNLSIEFFLNAESAHTPHHNVEIKVNNGKTHVAASAQSKDMYAAIDAVVDKSCAQIRKEKNKALTKKQRIETEKKLFLQE